MRKFLVLSLLLWLIAFAGCQVDRHHGHIYIHDSKHIEAVFDRPMAMSVEQDGVKVEASSIKPGFFEDVLKFLLLAPR
ncbi:hypothetical protein LCGC14_1789920 [marine sediment metagenome]|uniref:Uncharacterized protein n=1 Tax=marine sediment metagenome TaxID=412755 RepID=A0A0F9HFF2_9ZZZZ